MAFENAEELYKIFAITVDKIKNDKALNDKLSNLGMTLQLKVPNIDAIITIECKGDLVASFGPSSIQPDTTTINNDDIFVKFWQGKLNLMIAITKGQVKTQGAITKTLKLLPAINPVYKMFAQALKEGGREDLVIK